MIHSLPKATRGQLFAAAMTWGEAQRQEVRGGGMALQGRS